MWVLRSVHEKNGCQCMLMKKIESRWSSSLLKCAKIVTIFNPISNNINWMSNLNFWKIIKYSKIYIPILWPINWVFALQNPTTNQ